MMSAGLRKLVLTVHVATSVGFPGAVACFLALAIIGLGAGDGPTARAAYVAMDAITWFVILPLSLGSLLSGLLSSLGTPWGLFRYYWVLIKLLMTVPSVLILLLHMQAIRVMASIATDPAAFGPEVVSTQVQMVAASALALIALLLATVLSVYKPRGLTRYGWRKLEDQRAQ